MNHRKILAFQYIWPGQYFRSIYTKALFVKRTDWYAEPILLNGLADESACIEFGPSSEVELLDEESQWPDINYRPLILRWNWDYIKTQVEKNYYWDDEGEPQGVCWVGSQLGIMPSGKIYAMWTSNQTPEDVNRDRQFSEALEAIISEKGYYADWESGDLRICKKMSAQEIAEVAGYKVEPCEDEKGLYMWTDGKGEDSQVPFEDEDAAWKNCCLINNLVN